MNGVVRRLIISSLAMLLIVSLLCTMSSVSAGTTNERDTILFVTHDPIRIDDEAELAAAALSGNGSEYAPYVISGYEINGTTEGVCIYIGNTTSYVILQDCLLHDAVYYSYEVAPGMGIFLYNAQNVTIRNNTCTANEGGILLYHSSCNNTVSGNICHDNNQTGISSEHTGANVFMDNTCNDNGWYGIYLYEASNSILDNNTCYGQDEGRGIQFAFSNHMVITNNTCYDNMCGLYVAGTYNTVYQNNLSDNGQYGIQVSGIGTGNTISFNTCNGNDLSGIYLYLSLYNSILNNTCIGNPLGIDVHGTNSINRADQNTISNNTCNGTTYGIYASYAQHLIISGNTVVGGDCGILLDLSSNYGTVLNNTCTGSDNAGIQVEDGTVECTISGNICHDDGNGIAIMSGSYHVVTENTCYDCDHYGILLSYVNSITVSRNICYYCADDTGIRLENTNRNNIDNNTCYDNGAHGICLANSNCYSNVISNNTCWGNDDGIHLYTASNNVLENNDLSGNRIYGIYLTSASNSNDILNNTCIGNNGTGDDVLDIGIFLEYSNSNNVMENDCNGSSDHGIYLFISYFNTISDNLCSDNEDDGIYLFQSGSNNVLNNTCLGSPYGFHLNDGDNNIVQNNTLNGNDNIGIYVTGSSTFNQFISNQCNNGLCGIALDSSNNNTLLNNTINHNGNPSYGGYGIQMLSSSGCTLYGNTLIGDLYAWGIYVHYYSCDNIIANNICDGNYANIYVQYNSDDNIIANNTCINSWYGIMLYQECVNDTISNNTCNDNNQGIWLSASCVNCTISNNICNSNNNDGILLDDGSNHITVSDNTCNGNPNGISLTSSSNNIVSGNTCDGNPNGINLASSNGNVVSGNECTNGTNGIFLNNCDSNTISRNLCSDDHYGILISSSSDNNTISDNVCHGGDTGIRVYDYSNDNMVRNNTCNDTTYCGIFIGFYCSDSEARNNTCCGNAYYGIYVYMHSVRTEVCENTCDDNDDTGIYVYITSTVNVTDNDCSGNGFHGIYLYDSSNSCTVSENVCTGNNQQGMIAQAVNAVSVLNNECSFNGDNGIYLLAASSSELIGNTCYNNSVYNIYVRSSPSVNITNNECYDGAQRGISVEDSSYCNVTGNQCYGHVYIGITSEGCSYGSTTANTCYANGYLGIYLASSANCSVTDNICQNNGQHGIRLEGSNDCTVTGNTCSNNNNTGLLLRNSNDCTASNNVCDANGENGVQVLICEGGEVTENGCQNNNDAGIMVVSSGNITISSNTCDANDCGICLSSSFWNTIWNNTVTDRIGISIVDSSNNTVSENYCAVGECGISLTSSQDNIVSGNLVLNEVDGISLSYSDRNTISDNECSDCASGILLNGSDLCTITSNNCHGGSLAGISLIGSDDQVLVQDNLCYGNDQYGIFVNASSGSNEIVGNTCHDNTWVNIYVLSSDGNSISDNLCYGNEYWGIMVYLSNDSEVVNNTCRSHDGGIILERSANCTVRDNTAEECTSYGISVVNAANNTVANNDCHDNDEGGISMFGSDNCTISGNSIVGNREGMVLEECDENVIENNTIRDNDQYAIDLISCFGNDLYLNIIYDNSGVTSVYNSSNPQAYDNGINLWNTSTKGNMWSDWLSPDANYDQIVDVPYALSGGAFDSYPLVFFMNIVTPSGTAYTADTRVIVSGNASAYGGIAVITWHNAANGASGTCTGSNNWAASVLLGEGTNDITVTVVNNMGWELSSSVAVIRDSVAPSISGVSPADGSYNNTGSVTISWTVSDATTVVASVDLLIDGGSWTNVTGNVSYEAALADGTHTISINATDRLGNYAVVTFTVIVDTVRPAVNITSPVNGTWTDDASVTVVWAASDATSGIDRFNVSVDGVWHQYSNATLSDTFDLADGAHAIIVRAYDRAGNLNETNVTFSVDATDPTVEILSPENGYLNSTGSVTVIWNASDATSGLNFFNVSIDGAWAQYSNDTRQLTFSGLADGEHTVIIRAFDMLENYYQVSMTFTVDTTGPSVSITSPANGSILGTGTVTVGWTASDVTTDIAHFNVSIDGAWTEYTNSTLSHAFTLVDGEHTVIVRAYDSVGNYNETSVTFTVDTTDPTLSITAPMAGSLLGTGAVNITWTSYDITSGVSSITLRIGSGAWTDVTGTNSYTADLADGSYMVHINATDAAGNSIEVNVSFTVDSTAPTAVVSPTGDGVAINATVIVEFSEAMNASATTLTVGGVTGTLSWNGNVLTFTPGPLAYNTEYTVTLSGKDLAGNGIELSWTFNTTEVGKIIGILVDDDGSVMTNVTVSLSNGATSVTDGYGRFTFANVTVGSYTLTITLDGYDDLTMTVNATANATDDLGTLTFISTTQDDGDGGSDGTIFIIAAVVLVIAAVGAVLVFLRLRKK